MYNYQLYGIFVASEFRLFGIKESTFKETKIAVKIKAGKLTPPPKDLPNTLYKPASVANQELYYLNIMDIAQYQINGKMEVIIDIAEGSNEKDAMAFFFDTVLTVLLLKHHKFVFHASAVKGPKGAVLICAPAGGGKSTLATVLLNKGFQLIEDDRCLLHWEEKEGQLMIKNYLPTIDLWPDVTKIAQKSGELKSLGKIRDNIRKIRYDASHIVVTDAVPVQRIFLINMTNLEDEITQKQIKGLAKVNIVKNFTHLGYLVPIVSHPKAQFEYLSKMVTTVPIFMINRSRLTKLKDFSVHIMKELGIDLSDFSNN